MTDIVSEEENEVSDSKLEPTFENLQKSYDDILDDSQLLAYHYASLNKKFQKLSSDFEKFKIENEELGNKNSEL